MITIKMNNPEQKITVAKGKHANPEKLIENLNSIQLLDAEKITNYQEIIHSAILAKRNFEEENNIAEDPYIELLLYLSNQRQIKKAINELGIKNTTKTFYLVTYENKKALKEYMNKKNIKIIPIKNKKNFNTKKLKKKFEKAAMLKVS